MSTWSIKYTTKMITIGIAESGVEMQIIMKIVRASNPAKMMSLKTIGIWNSTSSISLLNRFIMRPSGVDSKNNRLLRIIELSIDSCNVLDEFIIILTETSSAIRLNKTKRFFLIWWFRV